jgi:hypothetical protein
MESEGKIIINQHKPFGDITLQPLEKTKLSNIKVIDKQGKNYEFNWRALTEAQRKKIIDDLTTHKILANPA